jgi:ABC-type xylose transport system permease subunit
MLTRFDIEKYFTAEKQESLFFLILGLMAVLAALALLYFTKSNFWRGFAMPLILIGILQVVVGYTVYTRSDKDRTRVVYALDMNPETIQSNELPRMKTVMKNFIVYRYVEIFLGIIGLLLIIFLGSNNSYENSWQGKAFWYGLGIALFIQSFLILSADYFAEKRGKVYIDKIEQFVTKNKK